MYVELSKEELKMLDESIRDRIMNMIYNIEKLNSTFFGNVDITSRINDLEEECKKLLVLSDKLNDVYFERVEKEELLDGKWFVKDVSKVVSYK